MRDETESCPGRSVREELDDLEVQQDNGIDECFLVGGVEGAEARAAGNVDTGRRCRGELRHVLGATEV